MPAGPLLTNVQRHEQYRRRSPGRAGMSSPAVGLIGMVVGRVRGGNQPGEVRVVHGGLPHTYIAYCGQPLAVGAQVLVINSRGARQVDVEPWTVPGPDAAGVGTDRGRS